MCSVSTCDNEPWCQTYSRYYFIHHPVQLKLYCCLHSHGRCIEIYRITPASSSNQAKILIQVTEVHINHLWRRLTVIIIIDCHTIQLHTPPPISYTRNITTVSSLASCQFTFLFSIRIPKFKAQHTISADAN